MRRLIQIAGIRNRREAECVLAAGVDDLGFPVGPGVLTPDMPVADVGRLVRDLGIAARAVVITYLDRADAVAALVAEAGARKVQLHAPIAIAEIAKLRAAVPDLTIIKSLVVREGAALGGDAARLAPYVDAYLTDTYDPATGHFGATGKTHDWRVSRELTDGSSRPIILAGGLRPDNVARAISAVRPMGVDAHTGVEDADGNKDPEKLRRFVEEARRAFAGY